MYGKNRVNNEMNNINADKEKDVNRYVNKYINIINDKLSFVNVSELIDDLMGGIDGNNSNDIALIKLKNFKNYMLKSINSFNSYIKSDTKNNTEPDTKNNIKPDTENNTESDTKNNIKPDAKNDTEWDINDTRASVRKNQISIKNKYKSLLEIKKTIKNNIDSVYSALKKLPNDSHSRD